jgi:hypothetical protein
MGSDCNVGAPCTEEQANGDQKPGEARDAGKREHHDGDHEHLEGGM